VEKRNSMIIADEDVGEMIVIDNKLEVKRGNKSLGNNSYSDKEKPQPKRTTKKEVFMDMLYTFHIPVCIRMFYIFNNCYYPS